MSPRTNKPFLRVTKGWKTDKRYLAVKQYTEGVEKTLRSFGAAEIEDNWDKAIAYLLWAQKIHYDEQKRRFLDSLEEGA